MVGLKGADHRGKQIAAMSGHYAGRNCDDNLLGLGWLGGLRRICLTMKYTLTLMGRRLFVEGNGVRAVEFGSVRSATSTLV